MFLWCSREYSLPSPALPGQVQRSQTASVRSQPLQGPPRVVVDEATTAPDGLPVTCRHQAPTRRPRYAFAMANIIEFSGPALVSADEERHGLWSVDGILTFERPGATPDRILDGWVLPGLVDAHCHIGLGLGGAVDEQATLAQAQADLDAGTLLIRDCGSPADTRWVQQRTDLPRLIRSGRISPGVGVIFAVWVMKLSRGN